MSAIADLDRLERALIELEYAAADVYQAGGLRRDDREIKELTERLHNLIALSRNARRRNESLLRTVTDRRLSRALPTPIAHGGVTRQAFATGRHAAPFGRLGPSSLPPRE